MVKQGRVFLFTEQHNEITLNIYQPEHKTTTTSEKFYEEAFGSFFLQSYTKVQKCLNYLVTNLFVTTSWSRLWSFG